MGFHQWDTTFTLDPRTSMASGGDKVGIPEGCGNQVSVEFNLLYRFHCAISANDEKWTEDAIKSQFMRKAQAEKLAKDAKKNKSKIDAKGGGAAEQPGATMGPIDAEMFDPKMLTVKQFNQALRAANSGDPKGPRHKADSATFGGFKRDPITNMFDDKVMIETLVEKMNDPIGSFLPPDCVISPTDTIYPR